MEGAFGGEASFAGAVVGGFVPTSSTVTGGISLEGIELSPVSGQELPAAGGGGGAEAEGSGGASAGSAGEAGVSEPGTDPDELPGTDDSVPLVGVWDDNLNFENYVWYGTFPGLFSFEESEAANQKFQAAPEPRQLLDVVLLLDTTGSMGDELEYLRTNTSHLWDAINAEHPEAMARWALVVYRDEGDDYVTRSFDFTSDKARLATLLAEQRAAGGGDEPEAADQALAEVVGLDFRPSSQSARVVFWFTDAPHHPEHDRRLLEALRALSAASVHVYPVASAEVTISTSLLLRAAAQLSGGRYVFSTMPAANDSQWADPPVPCFYVTSLNDAILRMISIELSAEYQPPAPSSLVASNGNPLRGSCFDGTAWAF